MAAKSQLIGRRFGRLLVIGETLERDFGFVVWACRCDCGALVAANSNTLNTGKTRSCGCLRADMLAAKNTTHGGASGKRKERLYRIWKGMRQRCSNPNLPFAHRYVRRGIKVCQEWQNYDAFRGWALANGYADHLSIDRIDFNGDYEPANCRWIGMAEQARNTSVNNPWVSLGGKSVRKREALESRGLDNRIYYKRRRAGWSHEAAMTTPRRAKSR